MSTEQQSETLSERVERELEALREAGIVKPTPPVITRSTFHRLSPQEQREFLLVQGGRYTDDPPPDKRPLPKGSVRRSTFDAMDHRARHDFLKAGGRLVDDDEVSGPNPSSNTLTREEYKAMKMREQITFLENGGQIVD